MIRNRAIPLLWLGLVFLSGMVAIAQEREKSLELPQDPRLWINSHPWTMDQLSGKAVFFFFFEEGCPKCRARWPELNQLMESHADDPILFVGVSSGTDRDQMEGYIQQTGATWPVLLDPDRSFEAACNVGEISLQNIMQVAIVGGDGTLRRGGWEDLNASVTSALQDAKWLVDPEMIPAAMKATWRQIEFRNYTAAAPAIRKALKSPKEETKEAAEALLAVVQPLIDEKVAAAEAACDAGEKWSAFQAYGELTEQFKGYELPESVAARKKELQTDPKIRVEGAAMKTLQAALKQVDNTSQRKKGIAALKKLAKDKSETEAGRKAQAKLEELDAN